MNSTTSLPLTSLSMNCSIAMESLSYRRSVGTRPSLPDASSAVDPRPVRCATLGPICSVAARRSQGPGSLFNRRVEGPFHLENVVLVEAVDFDDGPRRIGPLAPKLLLDLVDQRPKAKHVSH